MTSAASENRYAGAAIRGYAYQFDATAIEILESAEDVQITIEGCEDFDSESDENSTAVQCKYHHAAKFSLKGIREPILQMLKAFSSERQWIYRLHVHYSDPDNVPKRLSVEQLKECLTEDKLKPKKRTVLHFEDFTDDVLEAFVTNLEIRAGESYEVQQALAMRRLKEALGASSEDAKDLHYPAAFSLVVELALKPEETDRTITRAEFLEALDKRPAMYTRWHREFVGRERYLKSLKQRIKRLSFLDPTCRRFLVLGAEELSTGSTSIRLRDLLKALASNGFGVGKLSSAKPWTVLLQADDQTIREVKTDLIRDGVTFNDGFEHLTFSPTHFDRDPIVNTGPTGKQLTATSFDLRIASTTTFMENRTHLGASNATLFFADTNICPGACDQHSRMLEIRDCSIEEIVELLGLRND